MRLKDLREDADLKQKEIAEYLHIKQNTYSQYENGQRQLPIDILIKLSEYYGVSTDYNILGLDKKQNKGRIFATFERVDKHIGTLTEVEKGSYILTAEIRSVCGYMRGFGC